MKKGVSHFFTLHFCMRGKNMHYSEIKTCDIADGLGVRTTLFVSGCRNHCKGCFQPETWDFENGPVFDEKVWEEVLDSLVPDYIQGLTLLGGDPFEEENQRDLIPFMREFKKRFPDVEDSKGQKQEVISIESYQEMFPIGKKVVVKYEGPDEQGDIRVRHLGFQGKIPRNTYPDGFFGDLLEGQELTTRVYYVDMMRQMITFCPYFNNDILPDILHGKVKNFVCEIINKPSFGNIELKFDGGKPSIFKLYQPNLWYNFLKTGKTYTSIGYDTTKSHVFVFKNRFFPAFAEKCSKGDVLKGIIAHKGYHSVAIANNYPGYIVDGDISLHDEGDECTLVVEDINEEQMFVTFKMV